MKILILQLARFGDIYSTWPALNALKRSHPSSQIHLLVRSRFKHATTDLVSVDCIHTLDTSSILEPSILNPDSYQDSLVRLSEFVAYLQDQKFDKIINLSFSPFSSYLTSSLKTEDNSSIGYSRYSDGHLALTDNWSSYFYSQVGIGRSNRIHLADIFAHMLNVELTGQDWATPAPVKNDFVVTNQKYIVVHLGASQVSKCYSPHKWLEVTTKIEESWPGSLVLIGSKEELSLAQYIEKHSTKVINLVGKTKISQLFSIVKSAQLLIGADSAPIHIASLVGCVTLNLSCANVNLWETGARAPGSRTLYSTDLNDLAPEVVSFEALSILNGDRPHNAQYYVDSNRQILAIKEKKRSIENQILDFIYFNGATPIITDLNFATALVHMYDVSQLAIEQLYILQRNPNDKIAQSVLQKTDEIMSSLTSLVPAIGVIIRWFSAEKIQIEPSGFISVLEKTFICYKKLNTILTHLQSHVNLSSYQGEKLGTTELERR